MCNNWLTLPLWRSERLRILVYSCDNSYYLLGYSLPMQCFPYVSTSVRRVERWLVLFFACFDWNLPVALKLSMFDDCQCIVFRVKQSLKSLLFDNFPPCISCTLEVHFPPPGRMWCGAAEVRYPSVEVLLVFHLRQLPFCLLT